MINAKRIITLSKRMIDEMNDVEGNVFQKLIYFLKMNVYYPIESMYHRIIERSTRSYAFLKHGWLSYDFDSHTLYDLMAFKLKRIHVCLVDGHCEHKEEDLNALIEAIAICERLAHEQYDDKYHDAHSKIWGEIDTEHIPIYNEKGKIKHYQWKTSRVNVKTEEDKKIETADFLKCFDLGEQDRIKDLDRLNVLFKEHLESWWD